jgi:hypothetical protein
MMRLHPHQTGFENIARSGSPFRLFRVADGQRNAAEPIKLLHELQAFSRNAPENGLRKLLGHICSIFKDTE